MAGHSKFKNIMHRKGAQDKKRAKAFTRAVKEIIVAAKSGMPDPDSNPRLRTAIVSAKQINLPKDKIDNAIKKATSDNNGVNYEEIRYEGYGASGIAIIVETMTDNKNRTASEVRSTFSKYGGSLGEQGSVSYSFNKVGVIIYESSSINPENLMEMAIEMDVNDCIEEDGYIEIICSLEKYSEIAEKLEKKFDQPIESSIKWYPELYMELNEEKKEKVIKLIDALDNLDDVQSVSSNLKD
ncbi:MAG: YebC/PmpR family DNA-binding regulatory protein [Candidatus Midichloriaceae bacterium]|jgi:YebC/PmpR family DNA-binding regulatory protein